MARYNSAYGNCCIINHGDRYGARLRFELRVNGVRNNVLKLYPGLNYIDRS